MEKVRLVADTNVLVTFFWKESLLNSLLAKRFFELYAPVFALEELKKYSSEILEKKGLSAKDFKEMKEKLMLAVEFIPFEEYATVLKEVRKVLFESNLNKDELSELLDDSDFFALALMLRCPLWSNDKLLKKQSKVAVLTTKEVLLLFA